MDVSALLAGLQDVGVAGMLVLSLVGLHRGWWVPGWVYRERIAAFEQQVGLERARTEKWMSHALSNMELAERAVQVHGETGVTA